jgi:hypothetical protein
MSRVRWIWNNDSLSGEYKKAPCLICSPGRILEDLERELSERLEKQKELGENRP